MRHKEYIRRAIPFNLEKAGLITKGKEKFRSLGVAGERNGVAPAPIVGTISAGYPIWVSSADEHGFKAEKTIEVPMEAARGRNNIYAFQVRGNSMVDAMIADPDILVMERADDIQNGDVDACWLEEEQEVTLKKIFFEGGRLRVAGEGHRCDPHPSLVGSPDIVGSRLCFSDSENQVAG
jgi:SOS-response transcriptional repressor LexA